MSGIKFTCSACPTQAEGYTKDGRVFYFRYRWGVWELSVSEPGGDVWEAADAAIDGRLVASGRLGDGLDGAMPLADAEALIREHLEVL